MRVLVCGGRDFDKYGEVAFCLDILGLRETDEIIHGGATGADACAGNYARMRGIPCTTVRANWARHGRRAGPLRNVEMLDMNPDLVVAFPGGRGTAHMVSIAKARGTPVIEVPRN